MELTFEQRLEELEKEVESSSNFVEIRSLIEKIASQFEVTSFRTEKFELLTLMNVVHKIVSDRDTTTKVLQDLQSKLGINLEYFRKLRLAYGWAGFVSPNTGIEIPERAGDAMQTQLYLYAIEKKLGYPVVQGKYDEITQSFLDNRNSKAKETIAQTVIQDDEYKALLTALAV